jgi:hypothetical protein
MYQSNIRLEEALSEKSSFSTQTSSSGFLFSQANCTLVIGIIKREHDLILDVSSGYECRGCGRINPFS